MNKPSNEIETGGPSDSEQEDFARLDAGLRELIASQKTLLLSTVSVDKKPEISTAPFVRDEKGIFYLFISELARHTVNLIHHPQAAILFIRPESEVENLFARERAVIRCRAEEVERSDNHYHGRLDAMAEKFGEVVGILRGLPDFHLFALHPESGQYTVGFGQAYSIDFPAGRLSPIGPAQKPKE